MATRHNSQQRGAEQSMPLEGMAVAIETFRSPSRLRAYPSGKPFHQMLKVIKVAAGDAKTIEEQAATFKISETELQEAAKHLLLRHLMSANTHGNHLLGLAEGASLAELKDNKRWLLKWLHPDRNPNVWEQKLFHRVSDFNLEAEFAPPNQTEIGRPTHKVAKRQHGWKIARNRQKDVSPYRVIFRTMGPIILAAFCVVMMAIALVSFVKA
jgi:hypothetical protein